MNTYEQVYYLLSPDECKKVLLELAKAKRLRPRIRTACAQAGLKLPETQ